MTNTFAQATNAPSNGASNAQDFQPLTRNPQQPSQDSLQPVTAPQTTTGQDILSQENVKISIPVSDGQPESPQAPVTSSGGINWLAVVVAAVVIVAALEYFFRRRERTRVSKPIAADAAAKEAAAAEPAPAPRPKTKKAKNKSKRKKSRR